MRLMTSRLYALLDNSMPIKNLNPNFMRKAHWGNSPLATARERKSQCSRRARRLEGLKTLDLSLLYLMPYSEKVACREDPLFCMLSSHQRSIGLWTS